ncbi:MAG: SDR family NAD(P)-dependent oxidoreductase, partial [Verrucomicrobia bacterium]
MKITVIGANGKIGRLLLPRLVDAGYEVRGMVRDQAQLDGVRATGAQPVVGDLDDVFEPVLEGADGVVFSAGSGGHTGPDRTMIIDLWGAIKVIRAAERLGAKRFLM